MVSEPIEERTWLFFLHSVQSLIQSGGMRLLQSWKQDPDLGSNSENSLLFSDSACLIRDANIKHSFWREPMSQGQACFHLTVGFLLSLFLSSASIKDKTVSLWVKQLVISPGPLCGEEEKPQCLKPLEEVNTFGGHGIICKSDFLDPSTINILDRKHFVVWGCPCPVGCLAAFWPLSTRCR